VLLVVLGHLTGWPRGGFVGVDVFFVVSGFLITGLLVSERERSGQISLRHFYARRVRRLMPAGVLALVVTDVVAALLLVPSRAHATVVDSLWALGFLANVHFATLGTDYFSLTRPPSAVQHYWSLSVEEQFYLVWPFLVLATYALARRLRGHRNPPAAAPAVGARARRAAAATRWRGPVRPVGHRALTVLLAVGTAASLAWSVVHTAHAPAAAYFSTTARAWELGAGALLALLAPRPLAWLGPVGLAGLGVAAVVITPHTAVPGYALVLPVAATVALLATCGEGPVPRLALSNPPIRYVGRISYSLYLWHWPVIVLAAALPGGTSAAAKALELALALLLSVASYHLVEEPFRRRRGAARLSVLAPAYAAVLVVVLAATWFATRPAPAPGRPPVAAPTAGASAAASAAASSVRSQLLADVRAALGRHRFPPDLDAQLADSGSPEWLHDKCLDVSAKNDRACTYGTGPKDAALLGDSVAVSWLPALRRAAALQGYRLHVLTRRQCANLRGYVSPNCTKHQEWVLSQVRQIRPALVILSSRYEGPVDVQQWQDGTRRMLETIAPYVGRSVVLAPPPESGNLQACYTRLADLQDCTAPLSRRWQDYAAAEQRAAQGRATFVDPRAWFCADARCPAVIAGTPVMFDGRHLTAAYAARLAPLVSAALS
jgi:peptidoglycan/LPS O-acetylase OafA/YrhL